ncbi:hypothetical protein TcCL_ESM08073, partial [Trypanosoma cruzi]
LRSRTLTTRTGDAKTTRACCGSSGEMAGKRCCRTPWNFRSSVECAPGSRSKIQMWKTISDAPCIGVCAACDRLCCCYAAKPFLERSEHVYAGVFLSKHVSVDVKQQ